MCIRDRCKIVAGAVVTILAINGVKLIVREEKQMQPSQDVYAKAPQDNRTQTSQGQQVE